MPASARLTLLAGAVALLVWPASGLRAETGAPDQNANEEAAAATQITATTDGATVALDVPAAASEPVTEPDPGPWSAGCELGFAAAEGNNSTRSLQGGCNAGWEAGRYLVAFHSSGNYGVARYGGLGTDATGRAVPRGNFIESQNNWLLRLREEIALTESGRFSVFFVESADSDHFKGWWVRWQLEGGLGYGYVRTDTQRHRVEAGLQYENQQLVRPNADGDKVEHRVGAVLTALGHWQIVEPARWTYQVSWMPNLLESEDWRLAAETGLSVALNSRLALKLAGRYDFDNQPSLVTPRDPTGIEIPGADAVPARKTDVSVVNTLVLTLR